MRTHVAAAVVTAAALAASGCGGDTSASTERSTAIPASTTGTAREADVVDQHPKLVATVCRHSHLAGKTKRIDPKALVTVAALATDNGLAASKLLDEVLSRC